VTQERIGHFPQCRNGLWLGAVATRTGRCAPGPQPTHDRAHKGESPRGVCERTRTRVGTVGRRESDMIVCNESSTFW